MASMVRCAVLMCVAVAVAGMGGCATPESLLGQDEAFVVRSLGRPDSRRVFADNPSKPHFGPSPKDILVGEPYVGMHYPSLWGEQWIVFLASPRIFERVHRRKPQVTGSDCVIDVQKYPRGAVF